MTAPIVFLSDLHFHNWKAHSKIGPDGVNTRLADGLDCFRQAVEVAKVVGASQIVIAGDVFHVRGHLKPSVLTPVAHELEIAAMTFPIDINSGNHDQENFRGGATSIDTLCNIPNVRVTTSPQKVPLTGAWAAIIPYFRDIEEFKAAYVKMMEEIKGLAPAVAVIHQGIDGIGSAPDALKLGADIVWLREHTPEGIWVFSGHYHFPSQYERFVNIGSPYQQTFGDEGQQQGCWIWYPHKHMAKFQSLNAPYFLTIDERFKDWERVRGNIVRARVKTATKGALLRDRAMEHGAIDAIILIEKEFVTAHEKSITISTPEKMLEEYISLNPKFSTNAERLKKLFREICLS